MVMKGHEEEWDKNGSSIMCDDWKDKTERTLINFLANCTKGSMFVEYLNLWMPPIIPRVVQRCLT